MITSTLKSIKSSKKRKKSRHSIEKLTEVVIRDSSADENNKKTAIVQSALELFSKYGFDSVSVREISNRAKVNLALINYHFENKENLYLTCIANFSQKYTSSVREILCETDSIQDFTTRMKIFLTKMIKLLGSDKQVIRMILTEVQKNSDGEFHQKIIDQMHPMFDSIVHFFEMAKSKKIIHKKLEPTFLAMMLMGALTHPVNCEGGVNRKLGFKIEDESFQNSYIEHLLHLVTAGAICEK